mgnify:CR=1 FL=1
MIVLLDMDDVIADTSKYLYQKLRDPLARAGSGPERVSDPLAGYAQETGANDFLRGL